MLGLAGWDGAAVGDEALADGGFGGLGHEGREFDAELVAAAVGAFEVGREGVAGVGEGEELGLAVHVVAGAGIVAGDAGGRRGEYLCGLGEFEAFVVVDIVVAARVGKVERHLRRRPCEPGPARAFPALDLEEGREGGKEGRQTGRATGGGLSGR